jgi:hypothetical protein
MLETADNIIIEDSGSRLAANEPVDPKKSEYIEVMRVDVHQAYREWARGTLGPYNAEDAYCAGYEMAMRVKEEETRCEVNAVVKNLRAISGLKFFFG